MKILPSTVRILDLSGFQETVCGSYCDEKIGITYTSLRKALKDVPGFNEGFFVNKSGGDKEDPNYPNDTYKTDVTFALRDDATGATITMWNYKNGPAYGEAKSLDEIGSFSVFFGNEHRVQGEALAKLLEEACH